MSPPHEVGLSTLQDVHLSPVGDPQPPDWTHSGEKNGDPHKLETVVIQSEPTLDDHKRDQLHTPSATGNADISTSSDTPAPTKRRKILFLDGLRGLAVILVVLHHSEFLNQYNAGAWGVDMFFVLSSFLLTMIFDKKAHQLVQTSASGWKWVLSLVDYFQRRFVRVYPLFALVAIFLACLNDDQRHQYFTITGAYDLPKVLTFTPGHRYFLFWTLPVEIGYYFVIPVFVLAMMAFGKKYWWLPVIPVYSWVFYSSAFFYRQSMRGLSVHLSTFVAGSMSAIVYLRLQEIAQKHAFEFTNARHRLALRVVEYITLAYLVSTCFEGLLFDWLFANPFPDKEGGARFISLYLCLLIGIELLCPSEITKCLEWNVLRAWGKISFSVYLLHPFVVFDEWVKSQSTVNRLFGQMILIYVVATVSFHAVEAPMQRMAGKISHLLASKTLHEWPYQLIPKLTDHLPVLHNQKP